MLELSPLLTAANASACSMPASISVSRSKPTPVTWSAGEVLAEPAERQRVLVDDRDAVLEAHQLQRERRADPPAAHDDDVHERHISSPHAVPIAPAAAIASREPGRYTSRPAG